MKTRQEIKAIARSAMGAQRGTSVVVYLLIIAASFALGIVMGIFSVVTSPVLSWPLFYLGFFFVIYPIIVKACGIFIKIYNRVTANASEMFANLSENYLRRVGSMALVTLFTMLWSMLLIIPGIIKGISYSMTAYILADCPDVTAKDAIKLSMRMTNGHKMDLFVMSLSFIGWWMLSTLTCHILGIVFVAPYMSTTEAGYYVELRDKAIASGVISESELYPGRRLQ